MAKITLELDSTTAGAILDRLRMNWDDAVRALEETKERPNARSRTISAAEVTVYVEKSLFEQYKDAFDAGSAAPKVPNA